ncbi:MAG: prolyl oligopeptidase family serine peptidase [Nibricoccus sp.]
MLSLPASPTRSALPRPSKAALAMIALLMFFAHGPDSSKAATDPMPAPGAVGTAAPERFFDIFLPYRTDSAAISPDGKLLAYSIRENDDLFVVTLEIDNPSKVRAKIKVGTAATSTPKLIHDIGEKVPPAIRWIGWATSNRLVVETNANLATQTAGNDWTNTSGAIFAVNADGTNPRTIVTPRDVEKTNLSLRSSGTNTDPNALPYSVNPNAIIPTPDQLRSTVSSDPYAHGRDPFNPNSMAGYQPMGPIGLSPNSLAFGIGRPRSPVVFDYAPGKPDWLTIRTSDPRDYTLFTVNVNNGDLKYGPLERTDSELALLLNRQGRHQIAVPNTLRTSFPHSYLVQKTGLVSLGQWKKLNDVAKIPGVDFTLSPQNYLGERSFPIGVDENPDILYYASNVGRDTYGIYALNLKTGERVGKPIESPNLDLVSPAPEGFPGENPLVFDRYTRQLAGIRFQGTVRGAVWLRPEIQQVQLELEKTFPGQSVEIMGWDQNSSRFLAMIEGPTSSGGYYIFDRPTNKAMEFVRSSPGTEGSDAASLNFSLPNPAGGTLSGTLAIPRQVRQKPTPIVVMCPDEPWERTTGAFNSEMNALSIMGFAVVQINTRGTWGFGAKHRLAAQAAFDEIQVADIVTVIDELAKVMPLNSRRVALFGHERGGYLAMRAVQLRPDRFRCAVGIEPTVNLASWLAESRWTPSSVTASREAAGLSAPALSRTFFGEKLLKQNPLMEKPESITRPVFVLAYRGRDGGPTTQQYLNARTFASSVDRSDVTGRFFDLPSDYMRGLAGARSNVMRHIEDFLNENIYAYNVKMGETEVVDPAHPPKGNK